MVMLDFKVVKPKVKVELKCVYMVSGVPYVMLSGIAMMLISYAANLAIIQKVSTFLCLFSNVVSLTRQSIQFQVQSLVMDHSMGWGQPLSFSLILTVMEGKLVSWIAVETSMALLSVANTGRLELNVLVSFD